MLPKKVKEAIGKKAKEIFPDNQFDFPEIIQENFVREATIGAEIALSTPPDGELVEEMSLVIQQACDKNDDSVFPFISNRQCAEICAAVAERYLMFLGLENMELKEALEAQQEGLARAVDALGKAQVMLDALWNKSKVNRGLIIRDYGLRHPLVIGENEHLLPEPPKIS